MALQISLDKVTIKDKQSTPLKPGNYLRMSVKNNGYGMDCSTMDRIFDSYFSTKKPDEGTGLGLAVVQDIITSYGGKIEVESEPDKGTTFHIFLIRVEQSQKIEEPTFYSGLPEQPVISRYKNNRGPIEFIEQQY